MDRLSRSTRQLSERPLPLTRLRAIVEYGLGIGIIPKPDDPSSPRSAAHSVRNPQFSVIANPECFSGVRQSPPIKREIATAIKLPRDDTRLGIRILTTGAFQRKRRAQFSVIANPGRFSRGAAISSLARTLFKMRYVPESEQIAILRRSQHRLHKNVLLLMTQPVISL